MRISRLLAAVALFGTVFASAPRLGAAESVTGQVVDLACYMLDKANTGNTHSGRGYACAQTCAKEGFQVGLITADGKICDVLRGLAANKNARLAPHLGHTVTVTCEVGKRDSFATITSNDLAMSQAAR